MKNELNKEEINNIIVKIEEKIAEYINFSTMYLCLDYSLSREEIVEKIYMDKRINSDESVIYYKYEDKELAVSIVNKNGAFVKPGQYLIFKLQDENKKD